MHTLAWLLCSHIQVTAWGLHITHEIKRQPHGQTHVQFCLPKSCAGMDLGSLDLENSNSQIENILLGIGAFDDKHPLKLHSVFLHYAPKSNILTGLMGLFLSAVYILLCCLKTSRWGSGSVYVTAQMNSNLLTHFTEH